MAAHLRLSLSRRVHCEPEGLNSRLCVLIGAMNDARRQGSAKWGCMHFRYLVEGLPPASGDNAMPSIIK